MHQHSNFKSNHSSESQCQPEIPVPARDPRNPSASQRPVAKSAAPTPTPSQTSTPSGASASAAAASTPSDQHRHRRRATTAVRSDNSNNIAAAIINITATATHHMDVTWQHSQLFLNPSQRTETAPRPLGISKDGRSGCEDTKAEGGSAAQCAVRPGALAN